MDKKITIIASNRSSHQLEHQSAARDGFKKHGIDSVLSYSAYASNTKHVVCWGWRNGKVLRQRGHEVIILERGYIGDRFKYTSIGWNGLNNYANFPKFSDNGERFRNHGGILKPWKNHGKHILIMGQVIGDASLKGHNLNSWYEQMARQAKALYNLPVYFRPHPEAMRRGGYFAVENVPNIEGSLDQVIEDSLFTIAYNSNSCLDSVLRGVPCYAGDKGTMAFDLCMKNIDQLRYPSREHVVHEIACKQWTLEEIASGYALKGHAEWIHG